MRITLTCICFLGLVAAATGRSLPLDPSPLEAFARQASTRIVRSDEITRLDTTKGHVVITAIVLENSAQPPDQMRGVRISLSQAGANDQVYVGESILPELRDALNEIAEGLQSERKKPTCESAACYIGSCRFRRLDGGLPQVHSLSAAYYIEPHSSGLSLSSVRREFKFPDVEPIYFSRAIARAIRILKQH